MTMETQHVFVCSTDAHVAAFVDALETMCYPVVNAQNVELREATIQENVQQEETYTIENVEVIEPPEIRPPVKRFRTNPKEQKEVIERLFEKQKACVTEKAFMNIKGNKRFKSDVWSCFGDIKLLISRSEAKKLKIPYYSRQCGNEEILLSKSFVGCFKCSALFIHDAQKSGTSTLRSHMRVCCRPRQKKKKGAPTIIFFKNKLQKEKVTTSASEEQKQEFQDQILKYLLSSQSSFASVEDRELQKLLEMCISIGAHYGDVSIESMLCPPENLTDYTLNDMYVKSINSFYTEFQYSYGASFSLDVWIEEQQNMAYISLICNYANTCGELKSIVMHTDEFNCEAKSSEDVKEWFLSYLNSIPVNPFKRLIVTDNQSNMVAAFKDEQCIRCAYQSINTAVQEAVRKALESSQNDHTDFASLLNMCKDLVSYFETIENQYQLHEPLKQCKDGKWTSILTLFRCISKYYDDILNILNLTDDNHLLSFDKAEISAVCDLFEIFERAQNELSSTTEPTMSMVLPALNKLSKLSMCTNSDFGVVRQLKNLLLVEIDTISKSASVYHRVACLLDPRYKRVVYRPQEHQINANLRTRCLVKECMEAPAIEDFPESHRASAEPGKERPAEAYSSNGPYDAGNSEKSAGKEVDAYLTENIPTNQEQDPQSKKFDPLKFWARNSDRYPNLSKVAMWILSCPASVIQTEQTYFNNNWLVNRFRTHQRPESISKFLFVKSFRKI